MNIVRIKPLKKGKREWSGFQGIRYKNANHTITTFINKHRTMVTGLSPQDEERLGKIMDKDLRNTSPFWYDYKIILTDKDLILNLDNPEDELAYKVLSVHPKIQKSITDVNPYAEYVIHNETDEAKVINEGGSVKIKAYTIFGKLSPEQKRNILKLYPGFVKSDSVSEEIISSKLLQELENNPSKFVELAEDKNMEMRVLLKDLVAAGILKKNKSSYKYGTDFLGHDEDSTIAFINDPENQSLKITLINELESK